MEDEMDDILLQTNPPAQHTHLHLQGGGSAEDFWMRRRKPFRQTAPTDADLDRPVGTSCVSHARTGEMTESSRVSLWASCEDSL